MSYIGISGSVVASYGDNFGHGYPQSPVLVTETQPKSEFDVQIYIKKAEFELRKLKLEAEIRKEYNQQRFKQEQEERAKRIEEEKLSRDDQFDRNKRLLKEKISDIEDLVVDLKALLD